MSYMTEREIEALLQTETRELALFDGTTREFTMMAIYWRSVDYLERVHHFSISGQIESAQRYAEFYRIDLDKALACFAALYHRSYRDNGVKVPFEPPVCPLFYRGLAAADR